MIRRPPRSTQSRSSAASDVYKRQGYGKETFSVRAMDNIPIVSNDNNTSILVAHSLGVGCAPRHQTLGKQALALTNPAYQVNETGEIPRLVNVEILIVCVPSRTRSSTRRLSFLGHQ
eukprot:TRINITY_DN8812_c0_g1_i3.p1 TRINITY_DN8812_c0_g1~~TRINITY_DN8812_c0_g1_i3.p1  ORF type:complete len:117 (+),score=9.43 TRINITY_DN8812_c0_g1_i3:127-477(+)